RYFPAVPIDSPASRHHRLQLSKFITFPPSLQVNNQKSAKSLFSPNSCNSATQQVIACCRFLCTRQPQSSFPEIQVSLPCFSSSPWFNSHVLIPSVHIIKIINSLIVLQDMSSGGGRANASASASASKSKQLKRRKNAPGSRKDPGWEYATDIEGDSKKTKCKFCSKVFSGGIFRFKHHLARKRRSICNFLVNSPKGTVFIESLDTSNYSKNTEKVFEMLDGVVEKVREENVLQIITDNASAYKAAGAKLMEKRKHLFWTPCAAHCLDLMLEDLEKKLPVHKTTIAKGRKITNYIYGRTLFISMLKDFTKGGELIRLALTRFATAYLTLGCLSEHKGDLMIDSDESPAMPFLYLELNQAMEKIKSNFSNIEKRYKPELNIIENRWNDQMSRPLHYAAYWLNPKVHFSANFNDTEKKLKLGLFDCVERLSKDRDESLTIMQQLDTLHHARGMFSSYGSMQLLDRKHPADWWSSFGDDVPELQNFAIQILSLTCSASGCERNWSVFERVHSKKRNHLLQKKMNDIVYVMYNSKLLRRQAKDIERIFDEIDSDDEWLTGEDGEVENEDENVEELVGVEDEATFENESTHEPSFPNDEHVSYFFI
ncbi:hypothetical protein LINPERPRIM_LOCUS20739, partial [Linum perenne]